MAQSQRVVGKIESRLRARIASVRNDKCKLTALGLGVLVAIAGTALYEASGGKAAGFSTPSADQPGEDGEESGGFFGGYSGGSGWSGSWESGALSDGSGDSGDGGADSGSGAPKIPVDTGNYPSYESTGPRVAPAGVSDSITTTHDGQIIEGLTVNGSIDIRHSDVVVRDVVVMGTTNYAIHIGKDTTPCPTGVLIEYTEVNMIGAPADASMPLYARCGDGSVTLDHLRIYNTGRPVRAAGNFVMTNSWVYSARTFADAHRSAISTHGGSNFVVIHNTFICELDGCSSAVNMYSDDAPVTNYLFLDNLVAGGTICLRGGETHEYPDETHDIRIINNRFSTVYNPQCGQYQAIAQFDEGAPGNVRYGNVFHESGQPVPGG
jgi:hypothetical protein